MAVPAWPATAAVNCTVPPDSVVDPFSDQPVPGTGMAVRPLTTWASVIPWTSVRVPVPAEKPTSAVGLSAGTASLSTSVPSMAMQIVLPLTETTTSWLRARRSGTLVVDARNEAAPPAVPVSIPTKLCESMPPCGYVTNDTATPANPANPRPPPTPPTLVGPAFAGSSRTSAAPSAPVPPPMDRLKEAVNPSVAMGLVYRAVPARAVAAGVRTTWDPATSAEPLNRQPVPGGGSLVPPELIETSCTACRSVAVPVPPVNAGRTAGARPGTVTDSRCAPSRKTVIVVPETVTVTPCGPLRRFGMLVEVAT